MADSTTEIDLDSVIDRLLEGELLFLLTFLASYSHFGPLGYSCSNFPRP